MDSGHNHFREDPPRSCYSPLRAHSAPSGPSVNYFGHAAIASERHADGGFVLASMLPDLAGMLRIGCPGAEDSTLRAGLAFHQTTDAVFHECPTFLTLNRTALADLRRAGLSRGPARAVAHLATEMLLDAELIRNADYEWHYFLALEQAPRVAAALRWSRPDAAAHFVGLAAHLRDRGAAVHSDDPERIVFRLARALGGRPRIEPNAQELETLLTWLPDHGRAVSQSARDLLAEVRNGLSLSPRLQVG